MNRLLLVLACLLALAAPVRAEGPDEQYVRIYQMIQDADRLNDSGNRRAAAGKYVEAQLALTRFRGIYAGWNERVVNYRLGYIATKLAPISALLAQPATETSPATTPAPGTSVVAAPTDTGTAASPISSEFEQVRAMRAEIDQLRADNRLLGAKLKEALSAQPASLDPREMVRAEDRVRSLQKENELLKAQLGMRPDAVVNAPAEEMASKLKEQGEAIAALRSENEILKKQTTEWGEKFAALSATAEAARAEFARQSAENETALRQLNTENLNLQKQVELWKQVAQSNQRRMELAPIPAMPPDAQRELLALRARVQTLEAKPTPYTAEELALFNKPAPTLAANNFNATAPGGTSPAPAANIPAPARNVSRGVPPGAGTLLRLAERAFAAQNYADAERKYLEVLRQDENNVTTLGNLASAQVEMGHFADAEKYAQRALALDPGEYFSLYVLGRIRFRENKLDEALDALSRSAQANPDYADTQNYLGIVLSEKGQRLPAEAALRRAIQLQPDNAVAHNNLAVVYATQTPPALALSRWHYQKAMAAGHPKNPHLEKLLAGSKP